MLAEKAKAMRKTGTGRLLRLLRSMQGLAQHDVARRVGLSQTRLCLIERGLASARPEEINAILRVLGQEPSALRRLGEEDGR